MTNREALRNANRQRDLAQAESRRWQLKAQVSGDEADWTQHRLSQQDVVHWGLQATYYDSAPNQGGSL